LSVGTPLAERCLYVVSGRGRVYVGTGVSTYCVHPGIVSTNLARDFDGSLAVHCFNWIWSCVHGRLMTPLEGASTTLYCCLQPSISNVSGRYYRYSTSHLYRAMHVTLLDLL